MTEINIIGPLARHFGPAIIIIIIICKNDKKRFKTQKTPIIQPAAPAPTPTTTIIIIIINKNVAQILQSFKLLLLLLELSIRII